MPCAGGSPRCTSTASASTWPSILGRGPDGEPLANPPLIEQLADNPVLADAKLIAEAWDAAGLYQVGTFPNFGRWAEWNGKFRDDLRRFVRGDAGMVPLLATRLAGSADLYQDDGRAPFHSINFITCHDGFTLADLVSYEHKHNEANGEFNADGSDEQFQQQRRRRRGGDRPRRAGPARPPGAQLRDAADAGPRRADVAGRRRVRQQSGGNNNAWCQDNATGWLDWSQLEGQHDLHTFCRHLIAFRQRHPLLRPRHFEGEESGERRLTWHGPQLFKVDWSDQSRSLGMHLQGLKDEAEIYLIAHAAPAAQVFILPPLAKGRLWRRFVDTALQPASNTPGEEPVLANQASYAVSGDSLVVLAGG